jgi:rfaE bifunctional protein kinase chain/domain
MTPTRVREIARRFARLTITVLGDFCLDRYLEIDPARSETSLETGLPVYNVARVRAQPGGAGTVVNNLAALGVGEIIPLGFAGDDGEGFELVRALQCLPGVRMGHFLRTPHRCTFTYCKPLVLEAGKPPRELNRLDTKNWSQTPDEIQRQLIASLSEVAERTDALVILDQVDNAGTGVVTAGVLDAVERLSTERPQLLIIADSRQGLSGYPPICWKMNRAELGKLCGEAPPADVGRALCWAKEIAQRNGSMVFVTLAEDGMLAAMPDGTAIHVPARPIRGEIDVVGAGDAVLASLAAALAAGASPGESLELASAAASVVIHQLGTTGAATVAQTINVLKADEGGERVH